MRRMEAEDLERKKGSGGWWFKWVAAFIMIAVFGMMVSGVCWLPVDMVNNKEAKLMLMELEAGLSTYKLDHGEYPVNSGDAVEGAFVLYKYLSGDFDGDGKLDSEEVGTKIYVGSIDWDSAKNLSQQRVSKIGGRFALVDPYGELIRYHCEPEKQKNRTAHNLTYDLWSLGGADPNSDAIEDRSQWLTNWD